MREFTLYRAIKELGGKIHPIGETTEDNIRYENLKEMVGLVEMLVFDLNTVAIENKDRAEYSRARAGKYAHRFLTDLREELSEEPTND